MESPTMIKDNAIRHHFDQVSGKWYFSIVDSVGIVVKSTDTRNYWKVLKNRLKKAQNQLVTECNKVKMKAKDGKFYLTDVGDEETIFKIIELVSPKNTSPFRQYFNGLDLNRDEKIREKESSNTFSSESFNNTYPQVAIDDEEFMLLVDGYQKDNYIIIETFIAGVNIENLSISVTCNTAIIKGERKLENYKRNYLCQELYWGKFSRTVELPQEVEINKAEVIEHNGLIIIKLPIINKNRAKAIKIKTS